MLIKEIPEGSLYPSTLCGLGENQKSADTESAVALMEVSQVFQTVENQLLLFISTQSNTYFVVTICVINYLYIDFGVGIEPRALDILNT
jgi:hypothetical protein